MSEKSLLYASQEQYRQLGLAKETKQWEDGTRTHGGEAGSFEWWYFDAHLDDGSDLVIVFQCKGMMDIDGGPAPHATLEFNTPDGRKYSERVDVPVSEFRASETSCDVSIGDCIFQGDLHSYTIHFKNEHVEADVRLTGTIPAWRPETGHLFFGDNERDYFAWLPAVPEGKVEADITIDGSAQHYSGTGYHDHNWGNIMMSKLLNHWYWGRTKIGGYTVISAYMTSEKQYDYKEHPVFMLAKDGRVIADDGNCVTFTATDMHVDTQTGKPVHDCLAFDYESADGHYRVLYNREADIVQTSLLNGLSKPKKALAKAAGINPTYQRFKGIAEVQRLEGGAVVETTTSPAMWELMYFGRVRR